MISITVEDRG